MQSLHGCKNFYFVFIRKKTVEKVSYFFIRRVYKKCGFQIIKKLSEVKYFQIIFQIWGIWLYSLYKNETGNEKLQEKQDKQQTKESDNISVTIMSYREV